MPRDPGKPTKPGRKYTSRRYRARYFQIILIAGKDRSHDSAARSQYTRDQGVTPMIASRLRPLELSPNNMTESRRRGKIFTSVRPTA